MSYFGMIRGDFHIIGQRNTRSDDLVVCATTNVNVAILWPSKRSISSYTFCGLTINTAPL